MFFDQSSEPQVARDARFLAEAVPGDPAPASPEVLQACLVELGMVMHEVGFASHEIEGHAARVANVFGTDAEVFATPTALFLGVGPREDQRTLLLRLEPADDDLDGMGRVLEAVRGVEQGDVSPAGLLARIRSVRSHRARPTRVSERVAWLLAFAVSCGGAAALLGGGARDAIATVALSLVAAVASQALPSPWTPALRYCLVAAISAMGASMAGRLGWIDAPDVVTLSAIIIFLPGLSLTRALADLARRDLAAGTARLMGALTTFLALGLGLAVGHAVTEGLGALANLPIPAASEVITPTWLKVLAAIITPPALAIILHAPWRHVPAIAVGTLLASLGTQGGSSLLGPHLGVGLGTLALGLFANVWARGRPRRHPATVLVPGLILLVPGTMGLQSLELLMSAQTVDGIHIAFETVWTAGALVAGLLVANAIAPAET